MSMARILYLIGICTTLVLGGCATYPTPSKSVSSKTANTLDSGTATAVTAGVPLPTIPAVVIPLYLHAERRSMLRMWKMTPHAANTSTSKISSGLLSIAIRSDAWFARNSGQFKLSALFPLVAMADVLAHHPAQVIWVIGHGPHAGNPFSLAARRADAIKAMLERHGVSAAQLRIMTRPMNKNNIPHVQIIVVPLQEGAIVEAFQPPFQYGQEP